MGSRTAAALFGILDDRIQQLQFLACGTVQIFELLDHSGCVGIGHPAGQLLLPLGSFGMIYDQIDRRFASDTGHLHRAFARLICMLPV